jgi:hypothetical protein
MLAHQCSGGTAEVEAAKVEAQPAQPEPDKGNEEIKLVW